VGVTNLKITGILIEGITSLDNLVCLCENDYPSITVIKDDKCYILENNKYLSIFFFKKKKYHKTNYRIFFRIL